MIICVVVYYLYFIMYRYVSYGEKKDSYCDANGVTMTRLCRSFVNFNNIIIITTKNSKTNDNYK